MTPKRDPLKEVNFATFQRLLQDLGFTYWDAPDGVRVYDHRPSGAKILARVQPPEELIRPHEVFAAKITLDDFGVLPAEEFEGLLRKAG